MIKILHYLITIRLRKFLPKGDPFAVFLFFIFYGVVVYFLNNLYSDYGKYFIYASILDIYLYHLNRKDLDLLRRYKNKQLLIFIEYSIYSLAFLFIYSFNQNWLFVGIQFLAMLVVVFLKQQSSKSIRYPFRLFDPFWHISFRNYKLIVFIPLVFFFNYVGWEYKNENLNIASLFIAALFACVPSFQREEIHHIRMSFFLSKQYLIKQIEITIYNTSFLSIPILLCFIIFQKWDLVVFVPLLYFFPIINILFKYSFYYNSLLHQLFFILFIVYFQSGLPLLVIPFLYYKSYKTIEQIQYVTNRH